MADPVHFYFDFSSSYSYFAYDRIGAVAGKHMRDLVHRPIALGAIFKERGHAPDMPGTDKGSYIFHDVERQAALLGKPYAWPKPFPYNSIPAARGFYWLDANAPDLAQPYVAAVFETVFGKGQAVDDPGTLADVAKSVGADAAAFKDGIAEPAIKSRLIEETEAAKAKGVFGAPSFTVGDELFWGADRLESLDAWLAQN